MAEKSVLLLYAHPSPHRSEINQPMFEAACRVNGVTAIDLYGEYPRLNIDIDREQQRLVDHDVVIFQFPLYWYSTPSILKEWQDLVLEYNFAYGSEGTALHGKRFLCALTAGAGEEAYHTDGYNHFPLNELLRPLEQTSNLTGMDWLPPFVLFGARTAADDGRLDVHRSQWLSLLEQLTSGSLEPGNLGEFCTLNQYLEGAQSTGGEAL